VAGEVPAEIGNLPNLEELDIGNNSLTGFIPYSIFNHSTIRAISLGMNFLSGQLPSGIGNWVPNLEELYLWGNEINGTIPSSISNASTLSVLELAENYFYGSIPYTLGNLRQLEDLFLHSNLLTRESATIELSFLSSLTNCRKLTWLDLGENPLLNGTLPISIGNFSGSLEYFKASGCSIKGNIPKQIGNLSNLLVLKLQDNELDGPIPSTVRGMRNLQGLYLDGNRLQGSIPNVICDLSKLSELFLSGNKLYGSLPTCWKSLTSLRKLFLDANHLTSNLPSSLWSLGDILQINLSLNSLSGPLPSDIGNLKVVALLDLSWNQLSGQIPAAIGGLQNLENLSLAHNKFQGFIPQSLGQSTNMQVLDLSHNNLSGVIPKSLEKLKHLKNLDVSFNRLDGEIPSGMDIAIFSAQSFMGNEGLCGPPRFKVPPCHVFGRSKAHTSVRLAYILPAVIAAILVLILILFLKITLKRNAKSASQEAPTLATWRRISYLELERATDRFSETNLVGQGSFGSVYSGTLSDGMSVAVKVFNLEIQGSFKSFDAECEVLRRIRHRNLVKIISCCSNNNFKALVLEYMPNGNLHKWLYSHNYYLDILQRMNIMIDVASSLEYLHHGSHVSVVHCDLKPSNILLDDDMIAYVGDFGISKLLGDGDSMTQTMTLATIGYMAPGNVSSQLTIRKASLNLIEFLLILQCFLKSLKTFD
jgi:LRR receptor-like serine/threonine-protein kinase FLS2